MFLIVVYLWCLFIFNTGLIEIVINNEDKKMKKILIISSLISLEVFAQSNTVGYLYGDVSDVGGGAITNCNVTAVNTDVGTKRTIATTGSGSFRIPSLSIGRYTVTANCDGYNAATLEDLRVSVGSGTNASMAVSNTGSTETETLDSMTVIGGRISTIDISSNESTTIFSEETLDRIPVARNFTAVALLAPGTTVGDTEFGNLASFGGATVGENAYFINGMDVTNFRNGLGGSTVPFEFYKEFQVKTGGYGVEFGRSTGGVINAVTKSGTNEWKFGAGAYYAPSDFAKSDPNIYNNAGTLLVENIHDTNDNLNVYVEAGGPIIKDKLFFYGLYNPRDNDRVFIASRGSQYISEERKDAFWGTKIDWFITDNHKVEFTAFSDKQDIERETYAYDPDHHTQGALVGPVTFQRGGENYLLKYTGYFGSDFSLSVLLGQNEYDRSDTSPVDETATLLIDARDNPQTVRNLGNWVNSVPATQFDSRDQFRIDADWAVSDNHTLRFGVDYQDNNSSDNTFYSGHLYWRYVDTDPGPHDASGGIVPDGVDSLAQRRVLERGGSFDVTTAAIYLEDTWTVTDNITLTLGLRNESFDNKNANGETFIKIDNQLAPRVGFSWDLNGDGNSKVFASLGRYHLPIAANTNVRMAGAELFTEEFFLFDSIDANGFPVGLGQQIGTTSIFGDGTIADVKSLVDANITPMYQDELILGYEKEIFDGVRAGVRYIYRDLASTIEDVAIDAAVIAWAGNNLTTVANIDWPVGSTASDVFGGFHQYVLTNPGNDMTIYIPEYDQFADLSAIDLNYPKSSRTYKAIELFFEKVWDGHFTLQGSYTYALNKGNNEGFVRSDNGQDDAGLTTLFDQPGLLDGAYGPLPNDRPHTVKIFGAWEFIQNWQLGFNALMTSGRPINAFGIHPTDPFAALYGEESFYQNGVLVPRGSRGRTPFRTNVDLSLQYTHDFGWRDSTAVFKVDLFNVFDVHTVTEVNEVADDGNTVNIDYLTTTAFQQPQYVRFSANFRF